MQPHQETWEANEAQLITRHLKIGCILVAALMPLGAALDWFVYGSSQGGLAYGGGGSEDWRAEFLAVRLASSVAALMILGFLQVTRVKAWPSLIGLSIAYIPVATICWMIAVTDGHLSPYYAGLNLVLLAIAFVLQWGTVVSAVGVALMFTTYLTACSFHAPAIIESVGTKGFGIFFNNLYFLGLTGLIVVVGSAVHARLRRREFEAQRQLDQNLVQIERSRTQLETRNEELELTLNQLNATEVQLQQSEKLALLGELSAGIIHEINNPLNTARQGIYALKQKSAALNGQGQADYNEIITHVEEGVQRVIGIVGNMRQFAYPEQGARETVSVSEVVETAIRMLISEWKKGRVDIKRSIPEDLSVCANRNGMVHVLINFLKNSIDALKELPEDGRVPTIEIRAEAAGRRVLIGVRDNGPGIAEEHQSRVFDVLGMGNHAQGDAQPAEQGKVFRHFFTTKTEGAGMGMGLGICRRIVRAQRGKISFRSQPGEMCEFTVDLPAADSMKVAV